MADLIGDAELDDEDMGSGETPDDPPAAEIAPIFDTSMEDPMPEMITFKLTSRRGREVIFTEPVVLERYWIWVPGEQFEPYNCVVSEERY